MTKGKRKPLLVGVLVLLMALTAGVTWVFWSAGIDGADDNRTGDITIGTAGSVQTELTFAQSDTGGRLIPGDIGLRGDEVHEITFTFNVSWVASDTQTEGASGADLTGVVGELDVSVTQIMIGGQNFLNTMGRAFATDPADGFVDAYLFEVDVDAPATIIGNGAAVTVTVTVRMNQPLDREMYTLVAGNVATLTFNFSVEEQI
ncbi:MAG: hypothetical protein FWB72_07215 [Firmicutes bacterium]|nr:hypothetical protein [Bacillota bacterium]